jgi:tetratricopeptide (TPR) repeat protein
MIILDTHTWLWWTNESTNLSSRADEAIQQSLNIFTRIKDRNGEKNALNTIGLIYSNLGDYNKALNYYKRVDGSAMPLATTSWYRVLVVLEFKRSHLIDLGRMRSCLFGFTGKCDRGYWVCKEVQSLRDVSRSRLLGFVGKCDYQRSNIKPST